MGNRSSYPSCETFSLDPRWRRICPPIEPLKWRRRPRSRYPWRTRIPCRAPAQMATNPRCKRWTWMVRTSWSPKPNMRKIIFKNKLSELNDDLRHEKIKILDRCNFYSFSLFLFLSLRRKKKNMEKFQQLNEKILCAKYYGRWFFLKEIISRNNAL